MLNDAQLIGGGAVYVQEEMDINPRLRITQLQLQDVRLGNLSVSRKTRIDLINFSNRTYNCLSRIKLYTLGDIEEYSDRVDLMKIRNFGPTSLREVKEVLDLYGLQLGKATRESQDPRVQKRCIFDPPTG